MILSCPVFSCPSTRLPRILISYGQEQKKNRSLPKQQRAADQFSQYFFLPYLVLLSYGIPSAFGAAEFLEVNARTISEIMYGIML